MSICVSPCESGAEEKKSSETRTHCHGILATVSVSQVTGTDITSCWYVCVCVRVFVGVQGLNWHASPCMCMREGGMHFSKADRGHVRGLRAMCACGQPDCVLCQRKHGQLIPSGRTTWHEGRLSMVPRHIGVVKINTVTLFGRKRH